MGLLNDLEIQSLVNSADPIIKNLSNATNQKSKTSLIQSSSIDLTIGSILLPGKDVNESGGVTNPLSEWSLKQGETAIILTREELKFPNNIAGFGFPPSRVSFKGLLMTNPGHVDPGYRGRMRFAVINMGKLPYVLREGDSIVTLLLFKLSTPPQYDWYERNNGVQAADPNQNNMERLSSDFLDISNRAKEEIRNAEFKIKVWQVLVPILVAIITGIAAFMASLLSPSWKDPLNDVKSRLAIIEKSSETKTTISEISERIARIEKSPETKELKARLDVLEKEVKKKRP